MTTFNVLVKARRGGRLKTGLTVDGQTSLRARDMAAEILGVHADIVVLEAAA